MDKKEITKCIIGTVFTFIIFIIGSGILAGAIAMIKTILFSFFLVDYKIKLIILLACVCSGIIYRQKWYIFYRETFDIR